MWDAGKWEDKSPEGPQFLVEANEESRKAIGLVWQEKEVLFLGWNETSSLSVKLGFAFPGHATEKCPLCED
jgi:hypothetical protein